MEEGEECVRTTSTQLIGRWLLPLEARIDISGILPSFVYFLTAGDEEEDKFRLKKKNLWRNNKSWDHGNPLN